MAENWPHRLANFHSYAFLVLGHWVPGAYKKRHFYIKLIKNIKIEIFKKSGLGGVFGPIWDPDSNSP